MELYCPWCKDLVMKGVEQDGMFRVGLMPCKCGMMTLEMIRDLMKSMLGEPAGFVGPTVLVGDRFVEVSEN